MAPIATDESVIMILSKHTEAMSNHAANVHNHNDRITKLEEDIIALEGSGSTLTGQDGISITNDVITVDFNHSGFNTDNITESTNLYYTDARARGAISVSGDLTYNSTTGEISFTADPFNQSLDDLSDVVIGTLGTDHVLYHNGTNWINASLDTSKVAEHTSNLYYTDARVFDTLNATFIGIGEANPSNRLHVNSGNTNIAAQFESTDATGGIMLKDSSGNVELTTSGTHGFNIHPNGGAAVFRVEGNGNVGIGTTNPDRRLHVNSGSINECARFESADTEVTTEFKDTTGTASIKCRNDFRFNNSTNGEVMRIANSGFVGIGQNSPNDLLHITSSDNDARVVVQGATGFDAEVKFFEGLNAKNTIGWDSASSQFRIGTANVDTNVSFCINSSRNIGIGTTDPSARLDVRGGSGDGTHTHAVFTGTDNRGLAIRTGKTGGQHNGKAILDAQDTETAGASMDLQCGGSTKLELSADGRALFKTAGSSDKVMFFVETTNTADNGIAFGRNGANNLKTGMLSTSNGTSSIFKLKLGLGETEGIMSMTNPQFQFHYNGDLQFLDGGSEVGRISVLDNERISLHTGTVGIEFNPSNQVNPSNGTGGLDNTLDLGAPGARWDDIYVTNVIQTSDKNEKTEIQILDVKELNVAKKAKTLLRKFKWIDSVNKNGKNARIHFGIIAQDLEKAFTDEGLDAGCYGMFTKSTYTDREGVTQTRYGVRYNELLAFIISAI